MSFFFNLFYFRHKALQLAAEDRLKNLQDALRAFGPNSQHFLSGKTSNILTRNAVEQMRWVFDDNWG